MNEAELVSLVEKVSKGEFVTPEEIDDALQLLEDDSEVFPRLKQRFSADELRPFVMLVQVLNTLD